MSELEGKVEKFGSDINVGSNDWIPCSDRLPDESLMNSVIGWDACRERCVFVKYWQGQWKLGDWEPVKITHWMNMPKQPEGV